MSIPLLPPGPYRSVEDGHFSDCTPITILSNATGEAVYAVVGDGHPDDEDCGVTDKTRVKARAVVELPELVWLVERARNLRTVTSFTKRELQVSWDHWLEHAEATLAAIRGDK